MAMMATSGLRQILRVSQKISTRGFATSSVSSAKGYDMGDSFEHATGIERWELDAKAKGNNDPFVMNMRVRGKGTKENPNIVQALDTYRMVGCSCAEDDTNVKWFWLFEGKPKRCQCGFWFKLESSDAPEKYKLPV